MADTIDKTTGKGNFISNWWENMDRSQQLGVTDALAALGMGIGGPKAYVAQALGQTAMTLSNIERGQLAEEEELGRRGAATRSYLEALGNLSGEARDQPEELELGEPDVPGTLSKTGKSVKPTSDTKTGEITTKTPAGSTPFSSGIPSVSAAIDRLGSLDDKALAALGPQGVQMAINQISGMQPDPLGTQKDILTIKKLEQDVTAGEQAIAENKKMFEVPVGGKQVQMTRKEFIDHMSERDPAAIKIAEAYRRSVAETTGEDIPLHEALELTGAFGTEVGASKALEAAERVSATEIAKQQTAVRDPDYRNKVTKDVIEQNKFLQADFFDLYQGTPDEQSAARTRISKAVNSELISRIKTAYPHHKISIEPYNGEDWIVAVTPDGTKFKPIQRPFPNE